MIRQIMLFVGKILHINAINDVLVVDHTYDRCQYCKFYQGKCVIGCIPVEDDLCHDKNCFIEV